METNAYHGCHKRIMFLSVDFQPVQAVVVQDSVIDTFSSCALFINLFIGIRATGDISVKADIPFWSGFDDPPIFGRRTVMSASGCMIFSVGAPPHQASPGFVKTVRDHTFTSGTDRRSIFIDSNVIVDCFRMAAPIIEVNKCPYFSFPEQGVSRQVVHGGIEAHILYGKGRHVFFQLMKSNKETNGVMTSGTGKA